MESPGLLPQDHPCVQHWADSPTLTLITQVLGSSEDRKGQGTYSYTAALISSESSPTSSEKIYGKIKGPFFSISINIHGSLHSHLLLTILFAKT